MGFLDRIGAIASGLGNALEAPPGLIMDLAKAPFVEDGDSGFVHTLWDKTIHRGSDVLSNLFGPNDSLVGSTIGAVPEQLRNPVGDVIHPTLEGSQWLYTNAISHPLATLITVGSLTESKSWRAAQGGESDWGALFDPDSWTKAWELTNHQSPGQAMAINLNFAFGSATGTYKQKDILDQGEINKFEGTDFYHAVSGITDAAFRWYYDPMVVAGEFGSAAKTRLLEKPLTAGLKATDKALKSGATVEEAAQAGQLAHTAQVSQYLKSDRWAKLNEAIAKIKDNSPDLNTTVGRIKNEIFPSHEMGGEIASAMGRASNDAEREVTMRILMGENNAVRLLEDNAGLAEHLRTQFEDTGMVHSPEYAPDYHQTQAYRPDVNPEGAIQGTLEGLGTEQTGQANGVVDRLREVTSRIDHEMKAPGPVARAKLPIKNSEFYQQSAFTKPVRMFINMRPSTHINLEDPNAVENMDRMLRESGMTVEERTPWVGKFSNAQVDDRAGIVLDAEEAGLRKLADKHGVSEADVKAIRAGGNEYRTAAMNVLQKAARDEQGRALITIPGMDEFTQYPMRVSDTGRDLLVADMKQIDKHFGKWQELGLNRLTDAPKEIVNDAMKLWRPATLLRPAWPLRIMGDHTLVMMGKLDGLSYGVQSLRKEIQKYATFRDSLRNYYSTVSKELGLGWGGSTGALFGGIVAGPLGAVAGGIGGVAGQMLGRSLEEIPYKQFLVNGNVIQGAMGNELDKQEIWKSLVSSRRDLDVGIGKLGKGKLNLFADNPEASTTVLPGTPGYAAQWERTVNDVLAKDPVARLILAHDHLPAESVTTDGAEAARNWLENTAAGKAHAAKNPVRAADIDGWTETTRQLVHDLTAGDPALAAKVSRGRTVTIADLQKAATGPDGILDNAKLPAVHQEFAEQATGRSRIVRTVQNTVEDAYKALGTLPLDTLINNRYFAWVYKREMARAVAGLGTDIPQATIDAMETGARKVALGQMRTLMYDYASRSEFADMVRNIMPFFPAWQQTIQRWAGVALENPDFIRKASLVLGAPGQMGATWKDPDTGESFIRFRLPGFAKALLGHGALQHALDDQGYMKFQLKGLTPALGAPGFGPWVDVALAPFVKAKPELADSLKMVFPYGIPDNAIQAFIPPNIQHLQSTAEQDGRSYRSAYNRILLTRLTKMSTGELPMLDLNNADNRSQFLQDVNKEAHQFSAFRTVVGALSPVSGFQYDTPYAPMIDRLRELQKADPLTAQDKFLDQYGEEFFHLTQSFTKLNNGIPASIQGEQAFEKYRKLVEQFPTLGGLITGAEGGGSAAQFSDAAYRKQLQTPIRPGSNIMERSQLSPEEIITQDDQRTGWIKFSRAMDLIDAEMSQRGLANINVKAAADLRGLKDLITAGIAKQHPQWFQDYQTRDENKWANKIAAMEHIAKDPQLSQRPDIQALGDYLDMRRAMVAELGARKTHGLGAEANSDLRFIWDTLLTSKKNKSVVFSDLVNRWLANDPLSQPSPNTIGLPTETAAA